MSIDSISIHVFVTRYRGRVPGAGTGGGYRGRVPGAGTGGGYRGRVPGAGTGGGYRGRVPGAGTGGGYRGRVPGAGTGGGYRGRVSLRKTNHPNHIESPNRTTTIVVDRVAPPRPGLGLMVTPSPHSMPPLEGLSCRGGMKRPSRAHFTRSTQQCNVRMYRVEFLAARGRRHFLLLLSGQYQVGGVFVFLLRFILYSVHSGRVA